MLILRKCVLPAILLVMFTFNSQVMGGGETSGGGIIKKFSQLSPVQALQSPSILRRYRTIKLPNLKEGVSARNVCRDDHNNIVVAKPMEYCAHWVAKLRNEENGKDYSVFKYQFQASAKARTRNGAREYYCADKETDYPTVPIKEVVDDCSQWSVLHKEGTKYFDTLVEATRFAKEAKNSFDPICEQWGKRVNTMPIKYKVDFHKDGIELGTHEFPIPSCGEISI